MQCEHLTPNPSVNRIARKLRLRVPSALRAPAAGYLQRWADLGEGRAKQATAGGWVELFGIVLVVPAAFVASVIYSRVVRFVLNRWPLSGVALWGSVAVLAFLVVEWAALALVGPVQLQRATGGAFFPLHLAVFFLSTPALANVLVVKHRETWLGSWFAIGVICAALALVVVLTQYGISEALYGVD